jgi:hypothetical protein
LFLPCPFSLERDVVNMLQFSFYFLCVRTCLDKQLSSPPLPCSLLGKYLFTNHLYQPKPTIHQTPLLSRHSQHKSTHSSNTKIPPPHPKIFRPLAVSQPRLSMPVSSRTKPPKIPPMTALLQLTKLSNFSDRHQEKHRNVQAQPTQHPYGCKANRSP